jgi:uncharacterized protein YcgI (DUF1989 family)
MAGQMVERIDIPKCEGRSFTVKAGQEVRVIAIEGPQAADLVAWNAHDIRESMSTWLTRQMSGNFGKASEIYTKLPAARVIFRVLDQRPDLLWLEPGRCNRLRYGGLKTNCQEILAAAVAPYGLSAYEVPEVLNVFMAPRLHEDGTFEFLASPVAPGDYFAMRADMDAVVAVSACPSAGPFNVGGPKPLRVDVWEERARPA